VSDLTQAFGEPSKRSTFGKVIHWEWKCKDGNVRIEAGQEISNMPMYGTDNKVKYKAGEFLAVLGVHDY